MNFCPQNLLNDELNTQLENQVLPDLIRHPKTVKLPSIKIKSFSEELTEWHSFFLDTYAAAIDNSSNLMVFKNSHI